MPERTSPPSTADTQNGVGAAEEDEEEERRCDFFVDLPQLANLHTLSDGKRVSWLALVPSDQVDYHCDTEDYMGPSLAVPN